MQSGPAVLLRAVVMLATIVVVPAVALVWNRWPEALAHVRAGRGAELVDLLRASCHEATTCLASAANVAPAPEAARRAAANPYTAPPSAAPVASRADIASSTISADAPSPVAAAVYQAPAAEPGASDASHGANGAPTVLPPMIDSRPAALPVHLAAAGDNGNGASSASSGAATASLGSPFQAMEQRLRTLGATYYLLEAWGAEGNLYRFQAKMSLAGNASYTRHFEATEADPLLAMRRVLGEVEAWRTGRQAY